MGTPKSGARVSVRRIGFGSDVNYLACPNPHNDLVAQAYPFCRLLLEKNRILHIPLTQLSIFCLLVGWFVSLFKWEKGIIMFFQVEEIHGDCFCSFVILGLGSNYFFHEAMLKNKHPWALVFIQIFEVDLK